VLRGDRIVLSQAITLVESRRDDDQLLAESLLEKIIHKAGGAYRIGITGSPGVGKSTFIEVVGKHITSQQKKLAVLTVDPSSQVTGGSILGDKTRMEELSKNPHAFIRPTPAASTLGGVASKTRETILLCEAAGYDVIIVETVGVGQSEVAVKGMVDFFLLLMLPGAGDELQGIKKGIVEIADALVITKADGDNLKLAKKAVANYQQALQLLAASSSGWEVPVLTASALLGTGVVEVWDMIERFRHETTVSGYLEKNRTTQNITWFRESFSRLLQSDIYKSPSLKATQRQMEEAVRNLSISAPAAARQLLESYRKSLRD
jgi:LAO/AO transport system kinase